MKTTLKLKLVSLGNDYELLIDHCDVDTSFCNRSEEKKGKT